MLTTLSSSAFVYFNARVLVNVKLNIRSMLLVREQYFTDEGEPNEQTLSTSFAHPIPCNPSMLAKASCSLY